MTIERAVEQGDLAQATILRYFNPVGAHPSGGLGEEITSSSSNLLPLVIRARLTNDPLNVHGGDYPTRDGTCVRDYVHVEDVVAAHLQALDRSGELAPVERINLGSGEGISVLELIRVVSDVSGGPVPHHIRPRRSGDAVALFAEAKLAKQRLGWEPARSLADACRHRWRWQRAAHEADVIGSPAIPEQRFEVRRHGVDGRQFGEGVATSAGEPLLNGDGEIGA